MLRLYWLLPRLLRVPHKTCTQVLLFQQAHYPQSKPRALCHLACPISGLVHSYHPQFVQSPLPSSSSIFLGNPHACLSLTTSYHTSTISVPEADHRNNGINERVINDIRYEAGGNNLSMPPFSHPHPPPARLRPFHGPFDFKLILKTNGVKAQFYASCLAEENHPAQIQRKQET